MLISLSSFSQSITVINNYPLVHKTDVSGIIDAQLQLNIISTKNYKGKFGANVDYLLFKNQISKNQNLLRTTFNIENNIMELGHSLGVMIVGDVGYYSDKSQNGLTFGYGVTFDQMLLDKTQLLITIKENMLFNNFSYLNLGVGIRRFI